MSNEQGQPGFFEATIWSTILKARDGDGATQSDALERLLTRYRRPIYRHIYASLLGDQRTPQNAEDLTQGFIAQCLRLDFLKKVGPEKGRFRTFIRECVHRYLRDRYVEAAAKKRGGGQPTASLDEVDEEGRRVLDPAGPPQAPDEVMDWEWAQTVLERAMEALAQECREKEKSALFEALRGHLGQAPDPATAAELGARLGIKPETIHVSQHRMRRRLGELIREEVLATIPDPSDLEDELRYLIQLLGQQRADLR